MARSLADAPANQGPQNPQTAPAAPGSFMGHSSADWQNLASRVAAQNAPQQPTFPAGFGLKGYANYQGGQQSPLAAYSAPPQPTDYMSLYQQGLNDAKSGISQRLQGDLGYIQQQQQLAGQAVDTLPGGINAAYGQANMTSQGAENAITAAQAKSGVGSLTPLSTYMAPVNAALQGTQTALLQNVPLLRIGAQQQADNESAMARQGASQDQTALQQQQMEFYQQQAAAQEAAQAQAQAAKQSALTSYQYSKQLQDDPNRNFGPSTAAGNTPVTDKNGVPQGYTSNEVSTAMKSKTFSSAKSELTSAASPAQQAQIWHEMNVIYAKQPAMLAALASIFPGGQAPPDPGPVAAANAHYFGYDASGALSGLNKTLSKLPGGMKRS